MSTTVIHRSILSASDFVDLLAQVHAVGEAVVAPNAAAVDRDARFPHEAFAALREAKLLSAYVPVEYGGLGLDFVQTAEQALEHSEYWLKLGSEILVDVGLAVESVVANDPFFGRDGRMMAASQKEQVLKFELLHAVATDEKPTAITSCNYHQNYFGHTFGIQTVDGGDAHTSCIGFGLERIALALFMTHGFDPDQWPTDVKQVLEL